MSSTFAGLNTMVRGLAAQQVSLDTVGHNVSNASTAGYSRQSVDLGTTRPETIYTGNGSVQKGTGVSVISITRARDALIDKQMWKESSTFNYGKAMQAGLGKIEGAFGEPTETGVQSVLNKFWDSLQTLATNASDVGIRTAVRERGVTLVNTIQHSAQQLKDMVADINSTLEIKVSSVNQMTSEIASLNKQIRNIESGHVDNANDLRDKRDLLVDQLSALVDVRVSETPDGTFTVQAGNAILVNGDDSQRLTVATPGNVGTMDLDYGYEVKNISLEGTYLPVNFTNGEIKGLIDMRDSKDFGAKGYLDKLSTISQFLLQDFNKVNRSGYGTDNTNNNNFFGAGGTLPTDPDPDYNAHVAPVPPTGEKNYWIKELTVNKDLFDVNGVAKIAAKSASNSIGVTQTPAVGTAGGPGVGAGGSAAVFAKGTYTNGDVTTSVKVTIGAVTAGNVTGITYSTSSDDGKTWSASVTPTGSGPFTATINGLDVTMNISDHTNNAAGNTYTYNLDKNTANSTLVVTQSNPNSGVGNITSASGTYNNGDIATNVIVQPSTICTVTGTPAGAVVNQVLAVKYSTDGGANWITSGSAMGATLNADGTFSIPISGVTVKLQIATKAGNSVTDQYKFTLSKGNVASGDNAVLLSKKLKVDTTASLGSTSLDGYYASMISALGVQSQDSIRLTDNQQTLIDQITSWRESVSGVNMDEEMTNMIKFQKGYQAAARMLTTMDEMLDKLINGTGMVGR